jgi:signal transduction histidine kinase
MFSSNLFVKILLALVYLAFYGLASLLVSSVASGPILHVVFHACIIVFICLTYDSLYPNLLMGFSVFRNTMPTSRLGRFVRLIGAMHEHADLDSLFAFTSKALEGMLGVESSYIFYSASLEGDSLEDGMVQWVGPEENEANQESPSKKKQALKVDDTLLWYARGKHTPFFADTCPYAVQTALAGYGADFAIPAHSGPKLYCLVIPGSGAWQRSYSPDELSLLDFLCSQLNIAIERIDTIRRQQSRQEADYREKMSLLANLSANIAHEMRTPLSGVRSSISGVESYLPDLMRGYKEVSDLKPQNFPPIRAEHLEMLRHTPKRIKMMVDQANTVIDLLLVNLRDRKLDASSFSVCSMSDCVNEALETYPFKRGERERVNIELSQEFTFFGIQSLMVYVLFNLLKNALYSIEAACKGEISITLESDNNIQRLVFSDTGLGIKSEALLRIFEGFFTTKSDGTGAGLPFCRRTLNSFGGNVTAESEVGTYTKFILELPKRSRLDRSGSM